MMAAVILMIVLLLVVCGLFEWYDRRWWQRYRQERWERLDAGFEWVLRDIQRTQEDLERR